MTTSKMYLRRAITALNLPQAFLRETAEETYQHLSAIRGGRLVIAVAETADELSWQEEVTAPVARDAAKKVIERHMKLGFTEVGLNCIQTVATLATFAGMTSQITLLGDLCDPVLWTYSS